MPPKLAMKRERDEDSSSRSSSGSGSGASGGSSSPDDAQHLDGPSDAKRAKVPKWLNFSIDFIMNQAPANPNHSISHQHHQNSSHSNSNSLNNSNTLNASKPEQKHNIKTHFNSQQESPFGKLLLSHQPQPEVEVARCPSSSSTFSDCSSTHTTGSLAHSPTNQLLMQQSNQPMPPQSHQQQQQHKTMTSSTNSNSTNTGTGGSGRMANVECTLDNKEIWDKFHSLNTEMIITKTGRRMFPTMKVQFKNIDPSARYTVSMDIVPVDNKRYRYAYHKSCWQVAGKADPSAEPRSYLHPDSPFSGELLARQVISFEKVKLTNNEMDKFGHIILNSMHKYQPRIHLIELKNNTNSSTQITAGGTSTGTSTMKASQSHLNNNNNSYHHNHNSSYNNSNSINHNNNNNSHNQPPQLEYEDYKTFVFPETVFTAVTAYQNQLITKMKIDKNPFAKGFRDSSRLADLDRNDAFDYLGSMSSSASRFLANPHALVGGGPSALDMVQSASAHMDAYQLLASAAAASNPWYSAVAAAAAAGQSIPPPGGASLQQQQPPPAPPGASGGSSINNNNNMNINNINNNNNNNNSNGNTSQSQSQPQSMTHPMIPSPASSASQQAAQFQSMWLAALTACFQGQALPNLQPPGSSPLQLHQQLTGLTPPISSAGPATTITPPSSNLPRPNSSLGPHHNQQHHHQHHHAPTTRDHNTPIH